MYLKRASENVVSFAKRMAYRQAIKVDVSEVWERRMAALRAHASQLGTGTGPETYLTRPGFLDEIEARARVFGATIGARYGEGYRLRGPVPIADARTLLPGHNEAMR